MHDQLHSGEAHYVNGESGPSDPLFHLEIVKLTLLRIHGDTVITRLDTYSPTGFFSVFTIE